MSKYEELNSVKMNDRGTEYDKESKTTEAEKDNTMNSRLKGIANKTEQLLETMLKQLEKEDNQRGKLVNFFIGFTIVITLLPLIIIGIIFSKLPYEPGVVENIALLSAFINVPVSTIGVLRSIAKCLFNDAYRKTLPDMIKKITDVLAKYNSIHRENVNVNDQGFPV